MLSSPSVMRRPSSERKRPGLPLSSATQERPKMQKTMILHKRRARGRSCHLPPQMSQHGNEVGPPLPMWMSWRRSAIFPFSNAAQYRPNGLKKCTQLAVDFFGRPITTPTTDKTKPASSRKPAKPAYGVSFKFKEGNSAAVRKPVKMGSFL